MEATYPPDHQKIVFSPLILPVLGCSRTENGCTRLLIASARNSRTIIPVFGSEEAFLASRPAGSNGLKLRLDQFVQILDPADLVVFDPGMPHATVWRSTDLVALIMLLSGDASSSQSQRGASRS